MMRQYLFTELPITGIEKAAGAESPGASTTEGLGIGSMKRR
jgi:hypothetical protein